MGTSAVEVVRFHGRYYIRDHHYDGYTSGLGALIIADIPSDYEEYKSTPLKDSLYSSTY